ncbi:hypothetical protein NIM87_10220 [Devosia sp. XJ19-1]|uniref:Uncharacterized protein n=1 Tax=Devosia ureilytica TaxID=2952754 RepID=A0A9Q4FST8_9HYPH|nr:hypothetical protein [Devosia ureilytica]MCP8883875.1 hypothetical protein [Devosia ureilytica]MCP8887483.1 hypothetical protein [Devosia ureilytica]
MISEVGFRLAALGDKPPIEENLSVAFDEATRFLSSETSSNASTDGIRLTAPELSEVTSIAQRITELCRSVGGKDVTFFPEFRGLGMLEKCQGDIRVDDTIIEIKYVDRSFRSTDFRQALTYATLANLGGDNGIDRIILYNPLRGTYVDTTLEELIFSSSGRSVEEFEFEFLSVLDGSGVSR